MNWSSEKLLLMGGEGTGDTAKRVYLAGGPSLPTYHKFSASPEIVIDLGPGLPHESNFDNRIDTYDGLDPENITICALSTIPRPTVVSSLQIPFSRQYAEYVGQSTTKHVGSRTIIDHRRWLGIIQLWKPNWFNNRVIRITIPSQNFTYPCPGLARILISPGSPRYSSPAIRILSKKHSEIYVLAN